jgi:hypothetical protein
MLTGMKETQMKMTTLLAILFFLYAQESFAQITPVYVVLFTHVEDNTPAATLGSPEAKIQYLSLRTALIGMAKLAKRYDIAWSFEPDWKILEAALLFEDSSTMLSSNGKNFLRHMKEDLSVVIDPHSHEKSGYNYTDVAHLLDSLGVGGSKVIGGHIWDPSLPQFSNWERFRVPVNGTKYPWAIWQGEILMGSGTPNHVNDPLVSGIWRPTDKYNYFVDDPNGNICCVGKYKGDISSTTELIDLYKNNRVSAGCILTSSYHIKPADIISPLGLKAVEDTVLKPLQALRVKGEVVLTDFTALIVDWKSRFGGQGCIYDPLQPTGIDDKNILAATFDQCYPNPFSNRIMVRNAEKNEQYDLTNSMGKRIWAGMRIEQQDFTNLAAGLYILKVKTPKSIRTIKLMKR